MAPKQGLHRPDAPAVPTRVRSTVARPCLAVQGSAPHRRPPSIHYFSRLRFSLAVCCWPLRSRVT